MNALTKTPWEAKADRIIFATAQAEYRAANPRWREHGVKRHPYRLPTWVGNLVAVLGWHDRCAAEHEIKAFFHWYDTGGASSFDWR